MKLQIFGVAPCVGAWIETSDPAQAIMIAASRALRGRVD